MDRRVTFVFCIFMACIAQTITATALHGMTVFPKSWDQDNIRVVPRITGGTAAVSGEFRGKISVQTTEGTHLCGGTLIHASHVLTSALCVTDEGQVLHPSTYRLMGDDLTISVISGNVNRQLRGATHVFVHPEFNFLTFDSNLAVIRTDEPYVVSPTFNPVFRADDIPPVDTECSVAGWGSIFHNGPISFQLQRINATVISRAICNSPTSYNGLVRAGMFCAGTIAGGQDACQGDGGGGLICNDIVTGIVSWGAECGAANFPAVYVDIAVYNFWIDSVIVWNEGEHEDIPTPSTIEPPTEPTEPTESTEPTEPTPTPIPTPTPTAPSEAGSILFSMYLIVVNIVAVLLLK